MRASKRGRMDCIGGRERQGGEALLSKEAGRPRVWDAMESHGSRRWFPGGEGLHTGERLVRLVWKCLEETVPACILRIAREDTDSSPRIVPCLLTAALLLVPSAAIHAPTCYSTAHEWRRNALSDPVPTTFSCCCIVLLLEKETKNNGGEPCTTDTSGPAVPRCIEWWPNRKP